MNANKHSASGETGESNPKIRILIQLVIIVVVLALGGYGYSYLSSKKVKPRRKPPAKLAPMVQIEVLKPTTVPVRIQAMGTVVPARELTLKAKVGGQVIRLHPQFTLGGLLNSGEEMVRIDDADYAIAVTRAKGNLVDAEHALNVEMGYQQVAQKEWELLNGRATAQDSNQELALRKSHLVKAQAKVAAARAELDKARLDLERTRLSAPFNAMVQARHIDEGSHVGGQEGLATLVGTDAYWVKVSLPVDRLAWLRIPRSGDGDAPQAEVRHSQGGTYEGRVIRLLGDISDQGRMARLLVEVLDPLGLEAQDDKPIPLLLGEYVRVIILGKELADVIAIPRASLKDNRFIWLAQSDDTLEIRSVTPLWRDAEYVYLGEGVMAGERLITSDLAGPVENMPLQIAGVEGGQAKSEGNTQNEVQGAGGKPNFKTLDLNGDGRITVEELARGPIKRGSPQEILGRWDGDGDGSVSLEEFKARQAPQPGGEG